MRAFLILDYTKSAVFVNIKMKIFLKRAEAEKFIDLNAGDEIEFSGKVFSTALGDAWLDVFQITVLSKVRYS